MNDWFSILPHLLLAGGGFLIFCIGAFCRPRRPGVLLGTALLSVLSAAAVLVLPPQADRFLGMLEVQGYGRFFALLICGITALSLLFWHHYARVRDMAGDELYGLILLAALGMILVAAAVHWVTFFLGLELLSLSLYILIAARRSDAGSTEAAVKYFVLGSVASAFLTFGIAVLYAVTGTLDIGRSLAGGAPAGGASLLLLGFSLILTGIGFKISMVPFHLWTPDVYQGAPAPITAFLSTGSKVALFGALLRIASASGGEIWSYFIPVLWVLAALTMGVGNVSALAQNRVKRLLAYSSVAQMGYLLMALLAVKQNGPSAIMFYLAAYALMDLGAFGTLALLSPREGDLDDLEDCRGLGYSHPWRSAVLGVSLISLAGLPPTAGFIGKFALFWAVLEARYVGIAVIGILTVILSIYFYFKVAVALFMRPAGPALSISSPAGPDRLAGALIVILILLLGLIPGPLFAVIAQALPMR